MNKRGNTPGLMLTLGLLAGLAVVPVLANAASVQALFAQADANGDGGLDAAEYRRYVELGFAQDDATGDGSLDRQEMAQAMAKASQVTLRADAPQIQRAVTMTFPMLDADGDGRISREESLRYVEAGFKAIDADGDGRVSLQELLSARSGRGRGR